MHCIIKYTVQGKQARVKKRKSASPVLNVLNNTRQPIYVQRNIGARSRNQCCSGKAITIAFCVCLCVFVELRI